MNNAEEDLYGDVDDVQRVGNAPAGSSPPSKMENVAALGKNQKTSRVIVATIGAVAVVGAIAVVGIMSRNKNAAPPLPAELSGAAVGPAPQGYSEDRSAALGGSKQYQDIVVAAGKDRLNEAQQSGVSSQPLAVTVESALSPTLTPAEQAASAAATAQQVAVEQASVRARAELQEAQQRQQVQQATQPQYQQADNGSANQQPDPAYVAMLTNAQTAMSALLTPRGRGAMVVSLNDTAVPSGNIQQVGLQTGGRGVLPGSVPAAAQGQIQGPVQAGGGAPPDATQYTLIAAGEILSARIDTGMNTDVGGDFGATLLTGRYAGAKLIGTFQRAGELAAGTIRMISMPGQGVSIPATAIVLDAETGESGTATDVDRKLLVKYGIKPLAAGFAAVAQYLTSSGSTVVVNGETVTSTKPELTGKRAGQLIAGSAAQQVNVDANALDTTPTVRVKRGAIVGIFFTQDVLYTPKR